MTREPDFYKNFIKKFRGDDTKKYQIFGVPVGNAKKKKIQFHPAAPVINYHQKSYNSCCLSSLSSAFHVIVNGWAVTALVNLIEESLTLQTETFRNMIHFANDIMKNRMKIKGEQNLIYNLKGFQKNNAFDILKNISEYVNLVQLMESLGNMNHTISILGSWIFDSNYEKAHCLTQK